jgi:hypothetical protein
VIQLFEDLIGPRLSAQDGWFARDDLGPSQCALGNEHRGDIAAADIFVQRAGNTDWNVALGGGG